MTIATLPLSAIEPSKANPRTAFDAASIEGLAASIKADGLLQNLVVAPVKGRKRRYRLISGERRFRALRLLAERGELAADFAVPADIRQALSAEDSLRLATVENLQRENLPPLDEAAALTRLVQDGERLETLAAQTGLSARTLQRRLRLNHLCDAAREALATGAIDLAQAEALTLGSAEAQARLVERIAEGCAYSAADIKEHLLDDKCPVSRAIFPRERYRGSYTSDLFGDDESTYFDDVEQFFMLQREAVAELAERHAESAAWVEVTEDYRIPAWQYREAGAGATGGVIINLSPSGEVEVREGIVKREIDARAAGHPGTAAPAKKARPAYSAPLCRSLAHHKSAAVQSLLLADRRKAKEVTAVLLLGASDASESPLRLKPHDSIRTFAHADAPPAHYLAAERQCRDFAERLHLMDHSGDAPAWARLLGGRKSAPELYEAVKALDDESLDTLLALLPVLCFGQGDCERLDTADSLFNRVARDLQADMRDHWRPDAEFLTRRTREQLLEIAAESGLSAHRQTKKTELVQALARYFARAATAERPNESQQKARDWLPEAMRFPAIDPAHGTGQDGQDDQDEED